MKSATHLRVLRLLRYAIVGLLTLAVYLAAGDGLRAVGLPLFWEASVPFALAVVANFLMQRAWVFQDRRPPAATLPRYLVMVGLGFGINLVSLAALSGRMPHVAAQLSAAALVVISNACLSFCWVFLKPRSAETSRCDAAAQATLAAGDAEPLPADSAAGTIAGGDTLSARA